MGSVRILYALDRHSADDFTAEGYRGLELLFWCLDFWTQSFRVFRINGFGTSGFRISVCLGFLGLGFGLRGFRKHPRGNKRKERGPWVGAAKLYSSTVSKACTNPTGYWRLSPKLASQQLAKLV